METHKLSKIRQLINYSTENGKENEWLFWKRIFALSEKQVLPTPGLEGIVIFKQIIIRQIKLFLLTSES